jgi:autotransporter passenger strand-loop-strand repeat protein
MPSGCVSERGRRCGQGSLAGGTATGDTISSGGIQYDAGLAVSATLSDGGIQVVITIPAIGGQRGCMSH